MNDVKPGPAGGLIAVVAGLLLPVGASGWWFMHPEAVFASFAAILAGLVIHRFNPQGLVSGSCLILLVLLGSLAPLILVSKAVPGPGALGLWCYLLGLLLMAWHGMSLLSGHRNQPGLAGRIAGVSTPIVFGLGILFLWEVLVRGTGIPPVLLPAPGLIGLRIGQSLATLAADFNQTFIRAVIPGYVMGCTAGFCVAVAADAMPFLRRGLLPVGNLVSALPIIGIAPIMVMWFGFDWQSKAAVVVIMTFFPMLVNAVVGLRSTDRVERDLMATYGAGSLQTLFKLRLPAAMPFIFNALKINSTLALIGAIVAEFFGTPIVGMGFRISAEVGRMNIDLVWATIAVAALAGSLFYGLVVLIERYVTFWHPSIR